MRRSHNPVWSAIVLFGLATSGGPASRAAGDSIPDPAPERAPLAPVFASLERAWVVGNVDSLLGHFGARKVYLSLPDGGPDGGYYSRAQSYFILKKLFDATDTEEFSFVSIRQAEEGPEAAIGRAERTFRQRRSGQLLQDRIFVSLVREDDRWVVAEIKSLR
jgi:hypothetical protein